MLENYKERVAQTPSKAEPFELPQDDVRFVFNAKGAEADASDLPDSRDATRPVPAAHAHRFVHSPRGSVEEHLWNDWRWQQRERYRNLDKLSSLINLTPQEIEAFEKSNA